MKLKRYIKILREQLLLCDIQIEAYQKELDSLEEALPQDYSRLTHELLYDIEAVLKLIRSERMMMDVIDDRLQRAVYMRIAKKARDKNG